MTPTTSTVLPHASMTAIGDGIGALIARHMDLTFRAVLRGPQVVTKTKYIRLLTGENHPFGNFALIADSVDASETGATAAAIEPLRVCGKPAAMLYLSPVADAVGERLKAAGFELHESMPAMAVDIERLAATSLPAGYEFVRVGSGSEGDAWTEAFAVGYEVPRGVAEAFSPNAINATKAADAAMQFFAIVRDRKLVCTSLVALMDGVAGVYCVSTVPEERGKGLGAYATAEPLRLAANAGYRVGVLQSSAMGHRVYKRLGFADFGALPLYVKMDSASTE
jgi:GNAT superfamily N-acetyltransferase